jgi:CO/xanthine dehydrogenase Mo-binding subunit
MKITRKDVTMRRCSTSSSSTAPNFPSGMGEPPVIAVAPAIGNAVFAAVGVRLVTCRCDENVLGELPSTVLPAREVAGRRTSV